jgi:hypothetical protein
LSFWSKSLHFTHIGSHPNWITPQSRAAGKSIEEIPMMHKFQVGQSVALIPRVIRQAAAGTYEITRLMPENEVEPHYRIKSDAERHERVVPESELETSLTS